MIGDNDEDGCTVSVEHSLMRDDWGGCGWIQRLSDTALCHLKDDDDDDDDDSDDNDNGGDDDDDNDDDVNDDWGCG